MKRLLKPWIDASFGAARHLFWYMSYEVVAASRPRHRERLR
jgi:hypothetical protein